MVAISRPLASYSLRATRAPVGSLMSSSAVGAVVGEGGDTADEIGGGDQVATGVVGVVRLLPLGSVICVMRFCASRVNVTLLPEEWMIPVGPKVKVLPLRSCTFSTPLVRSMSITVPSAVV